MPDCFMQLVFCDETLMTFNEISNQLEDLRLDTADDSTASQFQPSNVKFAFAEPVDHEILTWKSIGHVGEAVNDDLT